MTTTKTVTAVELKVGDELTHNFGTIVGVKIGPKTVLLRVQRSPYVKGHRVLHTDRFDIVVQEVSA